MKKHIRAATLLILAAGSVASAQVSSINSAVINPRVFNDVPGSAFTGVNSYPSVSLSDANVSAPAGFANRHTWQFSNNGTTAYQFQQSDYFFASFNLTLTGSPIAPRKEAGFMLNSTSVGDIQFIVNTDGHEVVQFGGISFFSFNATHGLTYNSGDTLRLGMAYFQAPSGNNALQFSAGAFTSPIFEFAVGAGIGDGSTLGGYFQIVNDPLNPNNGGTALFQNLSVQVVPEPSVCALLCLGLLPLLFRRRQE